jgi:crotonobetainyl-CoA:carnitine CoA-transferase CaiB-like acyl-CoA transferase
VTVRPLPLEGTRIVEAAENIAGPYCTKLFVDAGADVIKVESEAGDPLRRWSVSQDLGPGETGALFRYLNGGKRSVVGHLSDARVDRLLASTSLVLEGGSLDDAALAALHERHPHLTVLSLSWFGRTGPWRDRPATEFTLQAASGSTMSRGRVDREPLSAGGRLGEWIAGGFAAAAGLAALRRPGTCPHLDVSIFECMCLTMGGHLALAHQMGQPRHPRYVELPSVERTRDGYVGFCTVTRQQFSDLLALIGHEELIGDDELATYFGRQQRSASFSRMVTDWTIERTSAEIIEVASLLRIPVTPIGTPSTVTALDHFVARDVFCAQPDGGFLRPRPPYRVDGHWLTEPRPAPALGEFTPLGDDDRIAAPRPDGDRGQLPLAGVRVVDFTAFWAGPSATNLLALMGADVVKVESIQRPDGIRFSSTKSPADEAWWEWSPIFQWMNVNKEGVTADITNERGRGIVRRLIEGADLLIENFSPRVLEQCGFTWDSVHELNPRTVMVRMPAFGLGGPWRDRPGFAQTMEQATGMAWTTGYPDVPPIVPKGPCDPTAGIHAAFAALVGLRSRDSTGEGVLVEVPMVETALNISAELVIELGAYGHSMSRSANRGPVACPQGTYRCEGDDQWVALAVVSDVQWTRLIEIVGDRRLGEADVADRAGREHHIDEIDKIIEAWTLRQSSESVERQLLDAGLPAGRLGSPYDLGQNVQLAHRHFFEQVEHPGAGTIDVMTLPFTKPDATPWITTPAPSLGQDNEEVLGRCGFSADEIAELARDMVIGRVPAGARS